MSVDIKSIPEFGRIDAESESQLREFFLKTDAYKRIDDQERIVVVGRKGTGKTAIYKALLQRADEYSDVFGAGLQFQDYPWGTHQEVQDSSAAPIERYSASWKFLIYVELAKVVLQSEDHKPAPGTNAAKAAKVLRDFIRTNWGEVDFAFSEIFRKREYTFKFEPTILGNKLGSLQVDKVPRDRLGGFLTEANRWLQQLLGYILTRDHWYFVLFDDLDRGYNPEDEEYNARLTGLLLASRDVFNWGTSLELTVAPTVFVRSDIYDGLSFPDKNKITQNLVETLAWTDDDQGENSLKALIEQRIRVITGMEDADPWDAVFEEQLMRGTQPKFKHMAARTYLRPRDMIQFANLCLERAKQKDVGRIRNEDIAAARPAYSEYLVSELDDEIHEVAGDWRRYMDVLRRVHTVRFKRDAFEKAFHELKLERLGRSMDDVLELLYRFSIIGFTKIGGGGYGGSAVAFRFRSPTVSFDPAAPNFSVHLGLKDTLELVEAGE